MKREGVQDGWQVPSDSNSHFENPKESCILRRIPLSRLPEKTATADKHFDALCKSQTLWIHLIYLAERSIDGPAQTMPSSSSTTNHLGGVDYATCSYNELRSLFEDRTGRKATRKQTKEQLISKLTTLDKQWNFRFLDLSAELRTWIYKILLTIDLETKRLPGNTSILRVCRQLHQEAKDILYSSNTFDILVSRTQPHDPVYGHEMYKITLQGRNCTTMLNGNSDLADLDILHKGGKSIAFKYAMLPRITSSKSKACVWRSDSTTGSKNSYSSGARPVPNAPSN